MIAGGIERAEVLPCQQVTHVFDWSATGVEELSAALEKVRDVVVE